MQINFEHFLEKFPELELPITLNDEAVHEFSKANDPLNPQMVAQFILPSETVDPDEFTEYIACLRIPETYEFHAIIFWRGGLMNYQFILATFDKKGNFINKQALAGTYSDGETLTRSIATIEEDWMIHIVSGNTSVDQQDAYDASSSRLFQLELLANGQIIHT